MLNKYTIKALASPLGVSTALKMGWNPHSGWLFHLFRSCVVSYEKSIGAVFIYNVYLSMWNFKHKRWTCMVNHVYLPMWPCSNTLILIAISNGYTVHMTHSIILQFGVVNKHHILKIIYSYCLYAKTLVYLLSNFDILLYNLFI